MPITSTGLGSGLDVESIVSSLMSVERRPITAIASEKTKVQSKISAFGTLKSALATFQTAAANLATPAKFNTLSATSADTKVFTASASGSATPGDYAIDVSQIAKAHKLNSEVFSATTDVVGTGTLTISFGTYDGTNNLFNSNPDKTDLNITVDASNNTLGGLRDAINAANASVTASIINDGTGYRLVLASKDTGAANSLKLSVTDGDGNPGDASGLSRFAFDPTVALTPPATTATGRQMSQLQNAQNALFTVDGLAISKASNTVTDAISGVTLTLLKDSAGSSVNLGVAVSKDKAKESVTAFVDAYNKLNTSLRDLTKFDETGKSNGALLGDATARSMITRIKSVLTGALNTSGALTSLNDIGVTFQQDGKLALNTEKFEKAVDSNYSQIANLFTTSAKATDPYITLLGSTSKTQSGTYSVTVTQMGSSTAVAAGTINGVAATSTGNNLVGASGDPSEGLNLAVTGGSTGARGTVTYTVGYAAQIDFMIKDILAEEGILAARTTGMNDTIKRMDKQTEALELRMTAIEKRYRAQFTQLDTLLSKMNSTSTYLTQQIASINANS